jgi:hypothetical protein
VAGVKEGTSQADLAEGGDPVLARDCGRTQLALAARSKSRTRHPARRSDGRQPTDPYDGNQRGALMHDAHDRHGHDAWRSCRVRTRRGGQTGVRPTAVALGGSDPGLTPASAPLGKIRSYVVEGYREPENQKPGWLCPIPLQAAKQACCLGVEREMELEFALPTRWGTGRTGAGTADTTGGNGRAKSGSLTTRPTDRSEKPHIQRGNHSLAAECA